jgi:hypothetical protein
MQVNHDAFLRVMHVPEDPLAVLMERSGCDDARHIGSGHPDSVIPAACSFRVCSDTCNVDKRDFESALESPELVSAPHMQYQLAFGYRQIDQGIAPVQLDYFIPGWVLCVARSFIMATSRYARLLH